MTKELKYTLMDYSLNLDENKPSQKKICISCLIKDVPFIPLSTCEHTKIFDILLDYKVEFSENFICYTCHNVLKKIHKFKNQANESINKLYNQSKHLDVVKPVQHLQCSNIEINSAIDSQPLEVDIIKPSNNDNIIEIATEIKIERSLDFEEELPLKAKKAKKKVSKGKKQLHKEYKGQIRIVMLTMEELLEERRAEALKKNYLKLPYKCEYCITGFDHELTLKSHMEKRHGEKSNGIECKICNSILGTKISFNEHHKRHFRRYECIECGRRNSYIYTVLKHYNENHGRIKTVFKCELCDFSTDTVHGQSSRVYSCGECGKQYRAKSGLAAHAATHAPSPAYCAECDAHFTSQLGLKYHLKHHSKHSERRFACNECDAKFIVKRSLEDHIDWKHLKNTEHVCNKCNKVFINSASLKKHKAFVHEKKRPPRNKICDHCGRGFTSLSILRSHIRTHTGERPLHCTNCPATFAHSAALYTHNKLLHSKT